MESPEGKPESFDDTCDRLTMRAISVVSLQPGVSNNIWIHHHGSNGQDVFDVETTSLKALFTDSIPISGILETRRWICDRLRLYLATNQTQPKQFKGRDVCRLCFEPVSVSYTVSQEVHERVCFALLDKATIMCLRCFTRIADEQLIPWDRSITFRPISRATAFRLTQDENNASAEKR